jgi:hypothetical protein
MSSRIERIIICSSKVIAGRVPGLEGVPSANAASDVRAGVASLAGASPFSERVFSPARRVVVFEHRLAITAGLEARVEREELRVELAAVAHCSRLA